jgi:hypothetical protein
LSSFSTPPAPAEEIAMTEANLYFEPDDVDEELLASGFYASTVTRARLRMSASGNRMIHVLHALDGVVPGRDRLADYFVLEGAAPHVLALTRRRLVQLYRAAGLEPRVGASIDPGDLMGVELDIRVEHDHWRGKPRVRVVEYRPRSLRSDGGTPF